MTDDLKNAETSLVWALDKASTSLEVRSAVNKALGYVRQAQAHAQCVPHHDLLAATVSCKGYDITISCDDYDIRDHLMDWLSGCRTPAEGAEVQDQWFTDSKLPVMAVSGDIESDRVLKLHFRRKVTDKDRADLVEAMNAHLEVQQLRAQVEEVDAWLAKAADQLNITPIMRAMDLGNEITQWRLARQKHSSTVLKTEEPQ